MSIWGRRGLTPGEIAMAREAFADPIDWSGVAIVQVAPAAPWGAMVPLGRTILFARWRAARDFARADLHEQGWFVHELAHVWQAARGIVLAAAKLSAVGHGAYSADWAIARPFSAYNIEQQAEIARFAFLAARGRPDPGGPDLRRLAALWPLRGKADA